MENPLNQQYFLSFDDAIGALRDQQSDLGFVMSIARSWKDKQLRLARSHIQCQRSGAYKKWAGNANKYKTSTKKTNCPFYAFISRRHNAFQVTFLHNVHNHDPIADLQSKCRLRLEAQRQFGLEHLVEMVKGYSHNSAMSLKDIATAICTAHPEVSLNRMDVYCLMKRSFTSTPSQALLGMPVPDDGALGRGQSLADAPADASVDDAPADAPAQGLLTPGQALGPAPMPLRIVTLNIRYATEHPVMGEQPWSVRCIKLCAQLRFISAGLPNTFFCLQEALYSQLKDVQARLGPLWAQIGRGRGEGETEGEFSPIFYRVDAWTCTRNETRWLSATPQKPSRGWDASLNRIVTMGEFSHRETGTRVVVMSTHFDHVGVVARINSAKLLVKFVKEWAAGKHVTRPPAAVLIGGDLNSTPRQEAYMLITEPGSGLFDIASQVPESRRYGNHLTYTSFGEPDEAPSRIDFLFIQETCFAAIEMFGVLANSFDDQIRLSDHRAVVADLLLKVEPMPKVAERAGVDTGRTPTS